MDTRSSQRVDADETLHGDEPHPSEESSARGWQPGAMIDRYVLTAELGRGAMGAVYSAVDPALDRRIALKLLRPGRSRSARLREEAQALAKVSSPHVVAVYDVGAVGEEIFIAMELVQGQTLTRWLAQEARDARTVLGVFIEAGQGLAAVHAAGLVHGDFKPANVMVDEAGRARVLDFGLARRVGTTTGSVTDGHGSASSARAHGSAHPGYELRGTPAYMSPEQISGREIDAASDQFSFCVSLWEAVYGQRPFGGERLYEIATALLARRPSPPLNRRAAPRWLYRTLLRGLAHEPSERWPSMDALVQELLRDRVRRRTRVALALGVVGLLGAGAWWQHEREVSRCERESSEATRLWNAEREASIREAIGRTEQRYATYAADRTVERIDDYAAAWRQTYQQICLASRDSLPDELRTAAYSCLDQRRRGLDVRLTALVHEQANAALRSIEALESLPPVAVCSDVAMLTSADDDPTDPELARAVDAVRDRVAEAGATSLFGRFEAAADMAQAAASEADALDYLPVRAEAHLELGQHLRALGKLEPSRAELRLAYALAVSSNRAALTTAAAIGLARLEGVEAGRSDEGREWAFHAAAHVERPGVGRLLRAEYHDTLGLIDAQDQRMAEATEHFERALEIRRQEQGERSLGVATNELHLAVQVRKKGDYERAWALQRDAVAIMREILGEHHPNIAVAYNNSAVTLLSMGRLEEAREYLERSVAIADEALPEGHPSLAYAFTNLGRAHLDEGELPQALEACDRALQIRERTLPPEHLHIAYTLVDRAELLRRMGRFAEAHATLERALTIGEARDDPEHPGLADALTSMGLLLLDEDRATEAVAPLQRALRLLPRPSTEYEDGKKSITQLGLARALWMTAGERESDREEARVLARDAIEQLEHDPAAQRGVLARDRDHARRWVNEHMR